MKTGRTHDTTAGGASIVARSGGLACIAALAFAGAASAQYSSGHESDTIDASAEGTALNDVATGLPGACGPPTPELLGQDDFYIPVANSWSGTAYTYAGNALELPQNPNGGEQFIAVTGDTSGPVAFARAQREVGFGDGTGIWTVAVDIAVHFGGDPKAGSAQNIGSLSTQCYPGAPDQSLIMLARWVDPVDLSLGWAADYVWYNEAGTALTEVVLNPGLQGLALNHWYRWTTTFDLDTNRVLEVSVTDLETGIAVTHCPIDRYLGGGSTIVGPPPSGFRYFGGSGTVSLNTLGFDNLDIDTDGGLGGDECEDAHYATTGANTFTTVGATASGVDGDCIGPDAEDVWYKYIAPFSGDVTIAITDADFDAQLEVYADSCGGAVTCPGPVNVSVEACDTLFVRIGGPSGAGAGSGSGTVQIDIVEVEGFGACCIAGFCEDSLFEGDCADIGGIFQGNGSACVPSSCINNDACADAAPIETGQTPFDNTQATFKGPDSCPTPGEECPADTNGDLVVDVQDLTNVILAWGSADPDADIDGSGEVDVQDLTAVILAWGACPAPPAQAMSGDIWFVWTADFTGPASAHTCVGPGEDVFDTVMAVYGGTACPPGDALDCNDDDPDGPGGGCSIVNFDAVTGEEYLLQVGGWAGNANFPPQTGNGTITIGPGK